MAKRTAAQSQTPNRATTRPTSSPRNPGLEQNVVKLAEQLGRMIGTVHAKADGLLDRETLQTELGAIRDAAADLVAQVRGGRGRGGSKTEAPAAAAPVQRSRGAVDAPGKRHRKPAPSTRGAKHSDTRIAKMKLAKEGRPPRRS